MPFRLVALCLFALLLGCKADSEPTPAGDDAGVITLVPPTGQGRFLSSCTRGNDCETGRCLQLSEDERVCTRACEERDECPEGSNWRCGEPREVSELLCLCSADGPERCSDGRDNDCNGRLDDCRTCGGREVPPDDRRNCGACGVVCPAGTACQAGECRCEDGAPAESCTTDETPECTRDADCADGNDCTAERCRAGRCVYQLAPDPCGKGQSCNIRTGRCEPGKACADSADCDDGDACTADERCDPALRVCLSRPLDGDHDLDPPLVCGGTDCDDSQPASYGAAVERCDGIDNDCDGRTDDPLPADACRPDQSCVLGSCTCNGAAVDCFDGLGCVDLGSDPEHCGSCGVSCDESQLCSEGSCVCLPKFELCDGACRDASYFAYDDNNCGGCGVYCNLWGGESCVDGQCTCPDGFTSCSGSCVDTASDPAHCGGCEQACSAVGESCSGGECRCAGDAVACGGRCTDPTTDPQNCGECGNVCTVCDGGCGKARSLTVGPYGNCAIMENGELYCWGRTGWGTNQFAPTRVDLPSGSPLADVVQVAVGTDIKCARTAAGHVYCWGYNADGRLGAGLSGAAGPLRVETSPNVPLANVVEIDVVDSACARLQSGEVHCWGLNSFGELGDGTTVLRTRPVRVERAAGTPLTGVVQLALAVGRACAVLDSGELYCWGRNLYGELGTGSTGDQWRPVRVETAASVPLAGVASVAMGHSHTCARVAPSHVYCWGLGGDGQLGSGQLQDSVRPVRVELTVDTPLANVVELGLGGASVSCARRSDSALYCWGRNYNGELGDGTGQRASRPVRVTSTTSSALAGDAGPQVSRSDVAFACAQRAGALGCWGVNGWGQLGNGSSYDAYTATPVVDSSVAPLSGVREFGLGVLHACALLESSAVYCWGYNGEGQLGTAAYTWTQHALPASGN